MTAMNHTHLARLRPAVLGLLTIGLMAGCQTTPPAQTKADVRREAAPEPEKPEPQSRLSYGIVTSKVIKGKTTQAELVDMFGGPNISTTDADGLETWVYERSASNTSSSGQTTRTTQAQGMDVFFGLGLLGRGSDTTTTSGRTSSSTSVRNITVIVKFNPDKTVKDYSARAATF